ALAELRAYGGLLKAGFAVKPGTGKGQPKPEFFVDPGDGHSVLIEVHAKQIDLNTQAELNKHRKSTEAQLQKFQAKLKKEGKAGGLFMSEPILIRPFGAPEPKKPGDTVTAN